MIQIPEKLKNFRFVKTKEKIPIEKEWQNQKNYSKDEFETPYTTYGVLCGYKNLMVVDADCKEINDYLETIDIFKETFKVKSAGKGFYHYYFISDKPPKKFKILYENKDTKADVQGISCQVIGPNSTLSNGKTYELCDENSDIKFIEYDKVFSLLTPFDETGRFEEEKKERKNSEISVKTQKENYRDEIKNKIKIKDLLRDLNINIQKNPTECPFHNSKGKKCLSFTDEMYHCFHCGSEGDIFSLYQQSNNCDFKTALKDLKEKAGITKKEKKQLIENKKQENKNIYNELLIHKFIIYKSKDETINKIFFNSFNITLGAEEILTPKHFRLKYFNETGILLPIITSDVWIELVNKWVTEFGVFEDQTKETNTDFQITECILNELYHFMPTFDLSLILSYGRYFYDEEEPDVIWVYNKVLEDILKKNQYKINMTKLKVLLDGYVSGNSFNKKINKKQYRFYKFNISECGLDREKIEEKLEVFKNDKKENN